MKAAQTIHFIVWGPWTMVLFLATGLLFTIRSGVFQIRGLPVWWRATVGSLLGGNEEGTSGAADTSGVAGTPDDAVTDQWGAREGHRKDGITAFQSACTALAATIGTGNIVGVATALTAGGPGALVWMWISALIGMMTAYAETVLGQQYRYRREDGHWMCGPMVYMERGVRCPSLGILYAILACLSSLGMGSMVQSNSMSGTLQYSAGIPPLVSGTVITALTAVVILGGINRISKVTERLMPLSAGIYIVFSLVVILSFWDRIPAVLGEVFVDAFTPSAAGGGVTGCLLSRSVRYGMSRGVFSNEAGLGSLAVLHGAAEDTTPQQQGMWAMFEVFFDTIVICTLTALVILCVCSETGFPPGSDGAALTAWCFASRLGIVGEALVSGAMVVFAFATVIAWYYLGRQTAGYLYERMFLCRAKADGTEGTFDRERRQDQKREKKREKKRENKRDQKQDQHGRRWMNIYTALYLTAVFAGSVCRLDLVWLISDLWNGLMAYPNILSLWLLAAQIPFPGMEKSGCSILR